MSHSCLVLDPCFVGVIARPRAHEVDLIGLDALDPVAVKDAVASLRPTSSCTSSRRSCRR